MNKALQAGDRTTISRSLAGSTYRENGYRRSPSKPSGRFCILLVHYLSPLSDERPEEAMAVLTNYFNDPLISYPVSTDRLA